MKVQPPVLGARRPKSAQSPRLALVRGLLCLQRFSGSFHKYFGHTKWKFQREKLPKQQKEARIDEYGEDSQKANSYLVEACSTSPVGMGIVVNHSATDDTCWANTLLKLLTTRFTLQASTRLQNLIGRRIQFINSVS